MRSSIYVLSHPTQLLLAPTPFIIGLSTSFLACKRNNLATGIPGDIWIVDLDAATVVPPAGLSLSDVPPLPEPEGKTLRNNLKQVGPGYLSAR